MSISDLAEVLFTSALQESEHPTPDQVRLAIDERLLLCHSEHAVCVARVAQEAGDHPDAYLGRIRWALQAVSLAYRSATQLAA
ncbi:MAG: hypothetical protein GEV10_08695 [Streptosporangiales bacterium]|nr:hypothetical protein [Streptosporangiales bacterium]